jgi:hypothetical protein
MGKEPAGSNVYLIGGGGRLPSADDIAALAKALAGNNTPAEELARIQARLDASTEAHRPEPSELRATGVDRSGEPSTVPEATTGVIETPKETTSEGEK